MKVIIEIPDNKASFALEVLRNLAFVKKAKPISSEKALLMEEIKEAVEELKLVKQGKIKGISVKQLLEEL